MNDWINGIRRALVITAHADDCEFFCGGLVALLASRGVEITEVIATDNRRGSFELQPDELAYRSREIEAAAAARIIGKKHVEFLGYPDGFLDETPKNELRRVFMEWIRRVRPDCLISFDATGFSEMHPDHRIVATAALEAVSFAHLPLFHPEQISAGLNPHMTALKVWFARGTGESDTVVDISSTISTKIEALLAHESQMRLSMQEWRMMLATGGRFAQLINVMDPDDLRPAIDTVIRSWAASQAEGRPFKYGEGFRVEVVDDPFEPFAGLAG